MQHTTTSKVNANNTDSDAIDTLASHQRMYRRRLHKIEQREGTKTSESPDAIIDVEIASNNGDGDTPSPVQPQK